ncbi:MAG: class I SAM-dependent methyltransferase [Thermoplasmatota archaeon]
MTLSVRREFAERVRSIIMDGNLFDPGRSIGRDHLFVHFPVAAVSERIIDEICGEAVRIDPEARCSRDTSLTLVRTHRSKPFDIIRNRAGDLLDDDELKLLPDSWEMIGDCLILSNMEGLSQHLGDLAVIYQSVLKARYTLLDEGGISGELRQPRTRLLIPPPDGVREVEHVENSVRFILDPGQVMFSSGNVDERIRLPRVVNSGPSPPRLESGGGEGETVVDMFAGIGYFTLPLAVHCGISRILAIEKNPVSYGYLMKGIMANDCTSRVLPILGDNRKVEVPDIADRIIMGYVGGTVEYLPRALELSRPEGCLVHLHDTVPVEKGPEGLWARASEIIGSSGRNGRLLSSRRIKSFAPRIDHVVLDMEITT